MKSILLKISELVFDEEIYPRLKIGWKDAYAYAQAMRAGSVFPPIVVGEFQGKLYVVDGWHRIEARKLLREKYVQGCVKRFELTREMFLEAIKLNSTHGRPLTVQEKARLIYKLSEMKFEPAAISEIVKVPLDKFEVFKTRVIFGPNGPVYVKSTVAKAGTDEESALSVDMDKLSGISIPSLLEQLIELLEHDIVPLDNDHVKELLLRLYSLLQEKLELKPVEAR